MAISSAGDNDYKYLCQKNDLRRKTPAEMCDQEGKHHQLSCWVTMWWRSVAPGMAAWKDGGQAVLILVSTSNSLMPHDIVPYFRHLGGLYILHRNIYAKRS